MTRRDATHTEHGSVLLSVVFLVIVIAGMSAALISTSLYRQSAARSSHEIERSFQAAMSGIDVALFEMRESLDTGSDGVGNASGSTAGATYSVVISPAFAGAGEYTLTATGSFGPASQALEAIVVTDDFFDYGLFGRENIGMSGSFSVDSWSSADGSYASQVGVDHAGEQGHVASNGDITAGGGTIWGDATPGPGFEVVHPENVVGATAPASDPVTPPAYVYSPPIASAGNWVGPGTLTNGTYRYDELSVGGSDVLVISGDVVLYVDGKFTLSGGSTVALDPGATLTIHHGSEDFTVSGGSFVNPDQLPSSLTIWSASSKKLTLSGGSDFFGLAYAPDAEFVSSGGSHLYGVVVVRRATLSSDGGIHFDRARRGNPGAGSQFTVLSMRRVKVGS